jgi:hypothetical protein
MTRYDEIDSPASCNYRLEESGVYGCGFYRSYAGARNIPCLSATEFPTDCPLLVADRINSGPDIVNPVTGKTIPVKQRSGKYDKDKEIKGLWSKEESDISKSLGPTRKYQKRPIVITASRILERIEIETPEGVMVGEPGDWLITGIAGEKYPCDDAIFRASYLPHGGNRCDICRFKDTDECNGETYMLYPICKFKWVEGI